MVDLELLERVSLLKGLSRDQLARIQPLAVLREFQGETVLFSEGEQAELLWFLISGRVELRFELPLRKSSPAAAVTVIEPGQTVGFSSLVPPHRYTLTGLCPEEMTVLVELEGQAFRELMDQDTSMGYIVMSTLARVISKRFRAMQDEVVKREGYELLMS